MQSMLNSHVKISEFSSIKIDIDNFGFLNKQSREDRELILLSADEMFIRSLNEEGQNQADIMKQALKDAEEKMKAK